MSQQGDVIEGQLVPVRSGGSDVVAWTPSFAVAVDQAIERKKEKRRFFESVMDEGAHYGVIPGTGTKPALLKAGAEMLLSNMGLAVELCDAEVPIRDYDGTGAGNGEGLIVYRRVARIFKQTGPREDERMKIAQAEGSCSSREVKYRWRDQKRACPACGAHAIIKGKAQYGGGWLCFKKQGGCGATYADGDAAIEKQAQGRIPNPDLADLENTILKMADKRALVAATLIATGCSDIFTQDVEENAPHDPETPKAEHEPPAPTNGGAADNGSAVKHLRERLELLTRDPHLTPAEVNSAIASVTGEPTIASIKKVGDAQRVIANLEHLLVGAQTEVPF